MIRAKFCVQSVTDYGNNYGNIKMIAECDRSIPENARFVQATPHGELEIGVTNPAVLEQMKPGKKFYLDFTEATN
ncbi:MAG: hypothetical protein WAX33_04340 [Rectinemataceae bacterium]